MILLYLRSMQVYKTSCISKRLQCSTQPVLYCFSTVEDIKAAVYKQADEYHTAFLMNTEHDYGNPMLTIGMNYIRFAVEEPHLFHLLFQSDGLRGSNFADLNSTEEGAKEIFTTLFVFVHGYASLFANNTMEYDKKNLITSLTHVFSGAVYAAKEGQHE